MASTGAKVGTAIAAATALAAGIIMKHEGLRYPAYPDPATGGAPWTICWGHTGPDVVPGRTATLAGCKVLLQLDMGEAAANVLRCAPAVKEAPKEVFASLISLTFNTGTYAVCHGSPGKFARAGDWPAVCRSLGAYKYANGRVFKGLVLYRRDETALCVEGLK